MKLDRNITNPRRGKYALIKLRAGPVAILDEPTVRRYGSDYVPVLKGAIDFGDTDDSDFFVIRLKDKYAGPALYAYANAARADDPEYAAEIDRLVDLAVTHPNKRMPD